MGSPYALGNEIQPPEGIGTRVLEEGLSLEQLASLTEADQSDLTAHRGRGMGHGYHHGRGRGYGHRNFGHRGYGRRGMYGYPGYYNNPGYYAGMGMCYSQDAQSLAYQAFGHGPRMQLQEAAQQSCLNQSAVPDSCVPVGCNH